MTPGSGRVILALGAIVVTAAAAAGLVVIGSPGSERQRRIDERRVEDLAALSRAVDLYRSRHGRLPDDLAAVERDAGTAVPSRDRETGRPFEYRVINASTYELCATFARPSESPPPPAGFWTHGSGRTCFRLEAERVRRHDIRERPLRHPGI